MAFTAGPCLCRGWSLEDHYHTSFPKGPTKRSANEFKSLP